MSDKVPFFEPAFATGQVFCRPTGGAVSDWKTAEYTGTCALYVRPNVAVTAGHCVRADGVQYAVAARTAPDAWIASGVYRHPKADVAVLVGRNEDVSMNDSIRLYSDVDRTMSEGRDFIAYGYPAEEGSGAVPRYFKGHFQRYFGYPDPRGRVYFAGEMSIPAPAGLSGGPVSAPSTPDKLIGIVTTNHDSYLVEDSYVQEERDGRISRGEIRRVVSYGIAAMLVHEEFSTWLKDIVEEAASL